MQFHKAKQKQKLVMHLELIHLFLFLTKLHWGTIVHLVCSTGYIIKSITSPVSSLTLHTQHTQLAQPIYYSTKITKQSNESSVVLIAWKMEELIS